MILTGQELTELVGKLSSRHLAYAEAFVRHDDPVAAREVSGWTKNEKGLNIAPLRSYVSHLRALALRQLGISTQLLAREIGVIAFATPADFFDEDSDLGLLTLKSFDDMPAKGAIKKIKFDKLGQVSEIDFYDKLAALKTLGDYIGMFKEARHITPQIVAAEETDETPKTYINIQHRKKNE